MSRQAPSLRADQLAATRERIIDAACIDTSPGTLGALSFAAVAARAGVSERTVFRHFPTMRALQEAVVARFERQAGWPSSSEALDVASIPDAIRRAFAAFGQHRSTSDDEPESARESRRRRRAAIAGALAPLTDGLPASRALGVAAVFHTLVSIETFKRMVQQWELSPRAAGEAAAWAAEVLLAELTRTRRGKGKPRR